MRKKAGFTLIEIMVSLTLVGLIATIAGSSVIMGAQAYLFARENDAITQKAQLAMNRINREFIELSDIKDASSTCVVYESPYGRRAIASQGNAVHLYSNYAATTCPVSSGDILIDGVQTLSVMYNPSYGVSLWSKGQDIRNLYAISVQIVIARADQTAATSFFTTVSPRNNNSAGGATMPTAANPPPDYAGKSCFIATAAYGDANHPIVAVLRDFRDAVLMDSAPGRAFVQYYYCVGPVLAEAIDGNEPACFFVRLLLAPVASLAFFILYCPFVLPIVVLVAWLAARFSIGIVRKPFLRRVHFLQTQRGAILVTLIAAMVVFSSLGAIMLSLFSSSAMSQVAGNNTMRAYYLAESGFRYAASRYVSAADDTARDALLWSLHDKDYELSGNDGKFHLKVYPYYYVVTETPTANWLKTEVKGGPSFTDPAVFKLRSWIQIKIPGVGTPIDSQIDHVNLSVTPGVPPVVLFYCIGTCTWDPSIVPGSIVVPACRPDQTRLTITDLDGDGLPDIAFDNRYAADIFPPRNGIITVRLSTNEQRTFAYRELDLANWRFKGVTDPNGGIVAGLTLATFNPIVAAKYVHLESVGSFGPTASPVTRKIDYYVPIGVVGSAAAPKTTFIDTMDNLSRWLTGFDMSHIGTQETMVKDGSSALHFTGDVLSQSGLAQYRESQIAVNRYNAGIYLYNEWVRAGGFLSYDVQAKVTVDPPPSPNLYAPGISFRMDENQNSMGFSLASVNPGNVGGIDNDAIPDAMTGAVDSFRPVFLLWMKEYNKKAVIGQSGSTQIMGVPFHYDYPSSILYPPPTGTGTYVIPNDPYADYWQTGDRVRFQCASSNCNLPWTNTVDGQLLQGKDYYIRSVWYFTHETTPPTRNLYLFDTYANAARSFSPYQPYTQNWDGLVDIIYPGTGTFNMIGQDAAFTKLAHQYVTSSGADSFNILDGNTIPKPWTTLLVRIVEAPSVSFINGGGGSKSPFRGGDIIYQTSNNLPDGTVQAIAQLRVDPVYREAITKSVRDSKWINGNADGVLILDVLKDDGGNVRPYTFTAGATLFVGGPPSGVNLATAGVPASSTDVVFRKRSNWISTYVGADTAANNPDTDPFNLFRGGISRLQVFWPPDDITATMPANDKYTAVRFGSVMNSSLQCKVDAGSGLIDMQNADCLGVFYSYMNTDIKPDILRFSSPDGLKFYSPLTTWHYYVRPEVGLDAYGNNITSIYFDQFALQYGPVANSSRQGFVMPIQR
ncbi:MAG TPA: prepilin-type N-terminal cleavage/methylation domain-containing protein [Syntrophales bacterium]|nr:prepilin-type N-terminal cleavage/methylation domain-containing protein [Syntrophales bacterium]